MVASIIVFLLGLIVLIGWYSQTQLLIQVQPSFVPMQYNTALGFLLCGLALFVSLWEYKKIAIVLGFVIFALGTLTLSQYVFGINLGIDEFFMRHYIGVKTSHPGRMAPNSAVCFILSGLAFVISNIKFRYSYLTSSLIASLLSALGFVAFFGYLASLETAYGWGRLTAMAIHSSFGFIILGLIIISHMWEKTASERADMTYRLPLLVAVAGVAVTACLWQALFSQEQSYIFQTTQTETATVRNYVKNAINTQVISLDRMAERWSRRGGTPQSEWESDAARYITDYKSYKAIEWVDKDFIVRWVVPLEGNAKAVNLDLSQEETRRRALLSSRDNKASIMSNSIDLVQNGKGILIFSPVYNENEFGGFILGVLLVDDLFKSILPEDFKEHYSIKIYDGDTEVFQNGFVTENPTPELNKIKFEETFETLNIKWKAVVSPNPKTILLLSSWLDEIVLLMGLFITTLLTGAVYLYEQSQLNFNEKVIANTKLVYEVKERKRVESVLRETSAFRQAIIDSANYMIISTDIDGTILTFNKTAEELLGYKAVDVVGKFSPEIIHIEDEVIKYAKELYKEGYELEPGFEVFTAKAKRNIVDEREWTYLHKNGTNFPIMLSISALRNEEGEITGFLGIGKDISEIKEANENLQRSEERFKTFMDNSPVVAFIRDGQHRYTFINKTFEQRFKVESENIIGNTNFEWLPKKIALRVQTTDKKIIEKGVIVKSTEAVPKSDGTTDYWMLIKFPISNPDGSNYVGGVAIDITESKSLEEELKDARDAALDSVRLKSEFLANMSHEIRTPMNGVLGMTEILLDTDLNEAQLDYASTIQQSADSLLTIINDILDFSKIEAGKIVFETIDFNLRIAVENTTALFAQETVRKGIEIVSLVETDVPTDLQGDPGRLKQVLVNLVGNAVKFTNQGSIFIKVRKVSETKTNTTLQFDVSDTGIGIKPDIQQYLFQAFTQADGSMTRKYGGTGLGLAISKQLVQMMKGEISVTSEPNNGSTFTFSARFEKQIDSNTPNIVPLKSLNNLRALIVDNATNREIISYQISSWGMLASEAPSAETALRLLKQAANLGKPYDLVFLDLIMPDIGGFELARLIRNDESLDKTKLILMPSFGKRGHAKDALQAGIDAYLVKPIRQADLYDCIATVMGKVRLKKVKSAKPEQLITRHTLSERRALSEFRILIAEDNLVNQKIATSQLKRLGLKSDVVSTGLEAIEALKNRNYSMILMDCQMPKMNGFEATLKIRENETEGKHIPIIAITANALVGEREKCLAAGMDEYLSKPFKQYELKEIIEKCLERIKTEKPSVIDKPKTPDKYDFSPAISERLTELREEVGEEVVEIITSLFVEDSVMRLKKMKGLIKDGKLNSIKEEAHSLKGSSANIGANRLAEMCGELEMEANNLSKNEIKNQFATIEASFLAVFDALDTLNLETKVDLVKT